MHMPINKKFKVTTEYHNVEPSETICETFEELTGTFECTYASRVAVYSNMQVSCFLATVTA